MNLVDVHFLEPESLALQCVACRPVGFHQGRNLLGAGDTIRITKGQGTFEFPCPQL